MSDCVKNEDCDTGFCKDKTCTAPGWLDPCKEGTCPDGFVCRKLCYTEFSPAELDDYPPADSDDLTPARSQNNIIILGIAGLVFVAFICVVVVVACVKCCRRQKRNQTTALMSPHAPSPIYDIQSTSPNASPLMYSPSQQPSPRYY